MANKVSEKLTNFEVFDADEGRLLGMADVELPNLEAKSDTISGAGIAGEMEAPTKGHYSAMSVTINWRNVEAQALKLLAPKVHALEFRGSIQVFNASTSVLEDVPYKVVTRCFPKSGGLGKLAPGAAMEPSREFSTHYVKVFLDGKEYIEIDQPNYICKIDGVDYLAAVRANLGL
jgi:hypothetical protein